jgi:membrane protein
MHMFEALIPVRSRARAPRMPPSQLGGLVRSAVLAWNDAYGSSLGAALAFYALACLASLLLVVLAGCGLVLDTVSGQRALQALLGAGNATNVTALLQRGYAAADHWLVTVLGLIGLCVAAAALFGELQDALNRIWRAPLPRPPGLLRLIRERLPTFALLVAVGLVVLVSLSMSAVFAALGRDAAAALGVEAINLGVSLALLAVALAALYRFLPRVVIDWRDVRIGAAGSALVLTLGTWLVGFYLGRGAAASPFGVAEALIALGLWVYGSAQIFLLGAQFTRVFALAHGSPHTQPLPATLSSRRNRNAGQAEAPILVKPWPYERPSPRSTAGARAARP